MQLRDLQTAKTIAIGEKGALIGNGAGVDITIDDTRVSPQHAKIYQQQGKWWIEDMKSASGVLIHDTLITAPHELKAGMRFVIADRKYEVVISLVTAATLGAKPAKPAAPPPPTPMAADKTVADPPMSLPPINPEPPPPPVAEKPLGEELFGMKPAAAPRRFADEEDKPPAKPPSALEKLLNPPEPVKIAIGAVSGVVILAAIIVAAVTAPPTPPVVKPSPPPKPIVVAEPTPPAPASKPVADEAKTAAPFDDYRRKRAEIEHTVEHNPLVLREEGILPLYDKLHSETQKAEGIAKKKAKKRPKAIEERVRDIEVFERTQGVVDALYEKLNP